MGFGKGSEDGILVVAERVSIVIPSDMVGIFSNQQQDWGWTSEDWL